MVRANKRNVRTGCHASLLIRFLVLVIALLFTSPIQAGNNAALFSKALSKDERVEAEECLAKIGYWVGPIDGTIDSAFRHALIAFQKVEGRKRTGKLTRQEFAALRTATTPLPRHTGFAHVEIDLKRQVLFVVDPTSFITHILTISTGNEQLYMDQGQTHRAHTPTGRFKVLRKISGWRKSTLGLLYYPSYISQGIAIHGSTSVPTQPASHGCIRIPMYAAKELSTLLPVGTDVLVYDD